MHTGWIYRIEESLGTFYVAHTLSEGTIVTAVYDMSEYPEDALLYDTVEFGDSSVKLLDIGEWHLEEIDHMRSQAKHWQSAEERLKRLRMFVST